MKFLKFTNYCPGLGQISSGEDSQGPRAHPELPCLGFLLIFRCCLGRISFQPLETSGPYAVAWSLINEMLYRISHTRREWNSPPDFFELRVMPIAQQAERLAAVIGKHRLHVCVCWLFPPVHRTLFATYCSFISFHFYIKIMTNDNSICRLFVKQVGTNLKKFFSSYGNVKSVYEMWIAAENMYFGCQ